MKQSALESVFIFRGRVIGLDNYKSKDFMSRVVVQLNHMQIVDHPMCKNQVDEVWENAKDPITGKVYDPSGVEITWDKTKPRNGQWDMGHIPGEKYSEMHQLYMDDVISKDEFLNWYRNPQNYRPELPSTNRSHKYE